MYFYTEKETESVSESFPELLQEIDGTTHEVLFTERKNYAPFSDGDEHIINIADLKTYDELIYPFYVSETSNPDYTNKIWIKIPTMNPHVYYNGDWVPLGAVYKATPNS